MQIHLKIIGITLILLALVHVIFPRYFHWKKDLQSMSLINKQVMQVHTFFIAFTVLLIGVLCLAHPNDLITTPLGRHICLGLALFWGIRFLFQLFVYSPKLWRGKPFETFIHFLFSFLWVYFTMVFFIIFLN